MKTHKKKSWKTTVTGLLSVLAGGAAIAPGVPPEWQLFSAKLAALFGGVGLISARDNNVTSEDAGAK
jgi:hypothetical protein